MLGLVDVEVKLLLWFGSSSYVFALRFRVPKIILSNQQLYSSIISCSLLPWYHQLVLVFWKLVEVVVPIRADRT